MTLRSLGRRVRLTLLFATALVALRSYRRHRVGCDDDYHQLIVDPDSGQRRGGALSVDA